VTVSGKLTPHTIELHIGGAMAAHGNLLADPQSSGPHKTLGGALGGRRVHLQGAGPAALGAQAALADLG
jgi:hypothetical protein